MEDRQITDYDNRFLREYYNMCKLMEDRQITDYYAAQRHIQSAMMGDTPVKTVQNRQYIDNVSNIMCHKLDLGPISLLGAQQHTTVEIAAAIEMQDNKKGDLKAHMQMIKANIELKYIKGQKALYHN